LPLSDLLCPQCGLGWDIDNIIDTEVRHKTEVIPLDKFVGKTLNEVKKHYKGITDAIYRMQSDIIIRNDKHIDLSPKYLNATKDWEKGIVKNERGWISEKDGITDSYVIQEGDEGFFNMWTYFHSSCNRKDLEESYREKFQKIFEDAGFKDIELTAITNKYCECNHCAPWYEVSTKQGEFSIGWRKRVIDIDWGGIQLENVDELFKNEDVTKGPTNIHAWGWDKAKDYLSLIYDLLK